MPRIFISYRRADSRLVTNRIHDRLVQAFGEKDIFKDVNDIPPGEDFRTVLQQAVETSDVMLVIIGPQWTNITDSQGKRRLGDPNDFVRIEVESGLARTGTLVIPVLVEGAVPPPAEQLPGTLRQLAFHHAFVIHDDPYFHRDIDNLVAYIHRARRTAHRMLWRWLISAVMVLAALGAVLLILPRLNVPTASDVPLSTQLTISSVPAAPTRATAPDLLPAALERARSFSGGNADWQPFSQNFDSVPMMLVPAGCFMMGSTDEQLAYALSLGGERDWYSDEQPVEQTCFDEPFWIDRYEVSNQQFARFGGVAGRVSINQTASHPREYITWTEARNFCMKREAQMPTEAQWEYAARGPDAPVFPWGQTFEPERVTYKGASSTANVGSRTGGASWVGALNMSGNVWEWVNSLYGVYPYTADDDRENPETAGWRVRRGGSWFEENYLLRAAFRQSSPPDTYLADLGFRCARRV